jgi:hypothetical protein
VTPAYPAATILAVVQLIVVVVAVSASMIDAVADHNVNPADGEAVIVELHPAGFGVNVPVDHV